MGTVKTRSQVGPFELTLDIEQPVANVGGFGQGVGTFFKRIQAMRIPARRGVGPTCVLLPASPWPTVLTARERPVQLVQRLGGARASDSNRCML